MSHTSAYAAANTIALRGSVHASTGTTRSIIDDAASPATLPSAGRAAQRRMSLHATGASTHVNISVGTSSSTRETLNASATPVAPQCAPTANATTVTNVVNADHGSCR